MIYKLYHFICDNIHDFLFENCNDHHDKNIKSGNDQKAKCRIVKSSAYKISKPEIEHDDKKGKRNKEYDKIGDNSCRQ